MTQTRRIVTGTLEVAYAQRARVGEAISGDAVWFAGEKGELRLAVIDGLGHGPKAARAAQLAVETVEGAAWDDLMGLMRTCDQALRGSRGAAVSLLRVGPTGRGEHCAVGNIEVRGERRHGLLPRPGIVGQRPKRIFVDRFELRAGELLVAYSDGVSHRLELETLREGPIEAAALGVVDSWGKDHDDATCVIIRRRSADEQPRDDVSKLAERRATLAQAHRAAREPEGGES